MSQLITLTTKTDGSFDNYFEDTIKIPANSEVAFIKSLGLNVKYDSHEFIAPPLVAIADRNKVVIRLCCDGVNRGFTWTQIYNAYASLEPASADEDTFLNGLFRWSLDPEKKGNIGNTFAKVATEQFLFYNFKANNTVSYNINNAGTPVISRFGLTSAYSTNKRLGNSFGSYIQNIDNLHVYTGTANITTDSIECLSDDTEVYSNTQIAKNGGMITFRVVATTQTGKIGIKLATTPGTITGTAGTVEIDFGIAINSNGPGTYGIIKSSGGGGDVDQGFHSFSSGTFPNDDMFTIIVSRTSSPENWITASGYTLTLLQGWDPANAPTDLEFDKYTIDTETIVEGFMPTFCITEGETAFEVDGIQCIPADQQDLESSSFATQVEEPANFLVGVGGSGYRNTHTFILSNLNSMDPNTRDLSRIFFNRLGFTSWTSFDGTVNSLHTTLGNTLPTNMVISTKAPADVRYQQIIYLPDDPLNDVEILDPADEGKILSETLPYLQFHIETLDAITYEGNFQKKDKRREQNTAVKVLQNIPKGGEILLSEMYVEEPENYTNYDYEVYNPLYVSLHNPAPISLNQIKGRLVSPDNQLMIFDNLINSPRALVMLHFRKELATN
tara:strand:+ start:296 stop:2134 length:1839 start_codon:yes stop_codon:yes gene_type:complete